MRARLRFWLAMLDAAEHVDAPRWVYLWLVGRTAAAIDWGEPRAIPPGEDMPF